MKGKNQKLGILVVEDTFPLVDKERIEKESGVNIEVTPFYTEGMNLVNSGNYDHVVTDISLCTDPLDSPLIKTAEGVFSSEMREQYNKIITRGLDNLGKNKENYLNKLLPILNNNVIIKEFCWKPVLSSDVSRSLRGLEADQQKGLIMADFLNKSGKRFTVYTTSSWSNHAYPALSYMVLGDIVPSEEYLAVYKLEEENNKLFQSDNPEENRKYIDDIFYIGPNKKLAVGEKSNPENWIKLFKALKK